MVFHFDFQKRAKQGKPARTVTYRVVSSSGSIQATYALLRSPSYKERLRDTSKLVGRARLVGTLNDGTVEVLPV